MIDNTAYFSSIDADEIRSGAFTFKDVFEVFDYIRWSGWNIPWYNPPRFECMEITRTQLCAVPLPTMPLFRGQNYYYDPSYPSLYRRKWSDREKFERLVQLEDFSVLLSQNPEVQSLIDSGLEVNVMGLAQHYGLETDIMDLTNSFGVAAFFATSYYDRLADRYCPILNYVSRGVIYMDICMGMLPEGCGFPTVLPIGQESLARPGEQRGFGVKLSESENFNQFFALRYFFWHNPAASMKCFGIFGEGHALFPYDPMAEKVRLMKKYRIYGRDSVEKVYHSSGLFPDLDFDSLLQNMQKDGCKIFPSTPFQYTEDELNFVRRRFQMNGWKD